MQDLIAWKNREDRKPLILLGARQVGKTYILKDFGQREFENVAYINCDNNAMAKDLFASDYNIAVSTKACDYIFLRSFFMNNLTELVFILDKSGSMCGMEKDVIGGFNSMIKRQREESASALVSTFLFSDGTEMLQRRTKRASCQKGRKAHPSSSPPRG